MKDIKAVIKITHLFLVTLLSATCVSVSQAQETLSHQINSQIKEVTRGLRFPEGPIAMQDGSVVLVEMERGTLSRVTMDGKVTVIAQLGGGPNGAAVGPDGAIYVCNNGGLKWSENNGLLIPGETSEDYKGGSIQRVELNSGKLTTLYTTCEGRKLSSPNDIVFDAAGGMWFTDQGKYYSTYKEHGGVFYAKADGSFISKQLDKLETPNGIRISPDGKTLYYSETITGRLWAYNITSPGVVDKSSRRLVVGLPGYQLFDSFALDNEGNICIATLINGGITIVTPAGNTIQHIPTGDILTTSICFGGKDKKTAFITLGGTGKLVSIQWNKPGLTLNNNK